MSNVLTRLWETLTRPPDLGPPLGVRGLGAAIPPYQIGRPTWPPQNMATYTDDGYGKSVILYACVNYRAGAVASAPLRVYRYRRGQQEEIGDHPLTALMQRPNPEASGAEFLAFVQLVIDTTGFIVIEKVRARAGNVVQLWPLRSDWIKPIPRDQRSPDWEYRVPGRAAVVLRSEDVIVITAGDHPKRTYTGLPPVAIALREVGIENAATDFLKLFFDRGAVPQIALRYAKDAARPKPEEGERIKEAFRQAYGGWQNWVEPALLGGGVEEIVKLGFNLDEMAYPELRNLSAAQICSAYRVTPILIGAKIGLEKMTYSNYKEARRHFYEDVVPTLWTRVDGAFTRSLLPEFESDPSIQIEFDTSDIPALQDDVNEAWNRATAALTAGGIMLDDFRAEIGLPPLPKKAGQVFLLPFSVTPTRPEDLIALAEEAAKPPEPVPAPLQPGNQDTDEDGEEDNGQDIADRTRRFALFGQADRQVQGRRVRSLRSSGIDVAALDERQFWPAEVRANLVTTRKRAIKRLAKAGSGKLRTFWRQQGERVAGAVTRSAAGIAGRDLAEIDWEEEAALLATLLAALTATTGVTAYKLVAEELGLELAWDEARPAVREVLRELQGRERAITQTTIAHVNWVVAEGTEAGLSQAAIAEQLRALFTDGFIARAMTVAHTEAALALNLATAAGYVESNKVLAAELSDNPDHTEQYRPGVLTCAERHGLVVPLEETRQHFADEHPNGSLCMVAVKAVPDAGEAA